MQYWPSRSLFVYFHPFHITQFKYKCDKSVDSTFQCLQGICQVSLQDSLRVIFRSVYKSFCSSVTSHFVGLFTSHFVGLLQVFVGHLQVIQQFCLRVILQAFYKYLQVILQVFVGHFTSLCRSFYKSLQVILQVICRSFYKSFSSSVYMSFCRLSTSYIVGHFTSNFVGHFTSPITS